MTKPKPYDVPGLDPVEFLFLVTQDDDLDPKVRQQARDCLDRMRTGEAWEEPLPDIKFLAWIAGGAYRGGGPSSLYGLLDAIERHYGPATRLAVLTLVKQGGAGPTGGPLH
jgi:hypothetical protein